jgi:hypothetical protein
MLFYQITTGTNIAFRMHPAVLDLPREKTMRTFATLFIAATLAGPIFAQATATPATPATPPTQTEKMPKKKMAPKKKMMKKEMKKKSMEPTPAPAQP